MGGAFNRGIQAYANGGMFTNSIVNQPTFFRAAQGLGVMGEAGPEAIMPLKRDSQGNLGVRSSQGNVEVVVNNFTQARAETRETTDSRGNRRIEVIVADLVAGEISRPNSNIQQSFVNSFGTKPMVARR
jgi:phage-related minor tail protein